MRRKVSLAFVVLLMSGLSPLIGQAGAAVTMTTQSDVIATGKPIELTLTFKNTTRHAISFGIAGSGVHAEENYRFAIKRKEDNHPVPMTSLGKAAESGQDGSNMLKTLEPGESIVETVVISKFYDLTLPGHYEITAVRRGG